MFTSISESERLAIQRAIFADMDAANADPTHPGWHFTPPAHFMLDVWGAIYLDGWYHIFYGVCRTLGAMTQDTVFGHARSRDLVHFEHLPLPICPAREELRMNDGCICLRGDGTPVMLYTSVPKDRIPRSHVAAVGTRDLLRFEREREPFMTLENHGGPAFDWGWSDPFVFEAFGRTFMVMSKCVERGKNRMPIYEAADDSMTRWEYRGIFLEDNGEVVNFFPVGGGKWMLIFCPYSTIRYFVGTFDAATLTFTPETEGVLCHGYVKQDTDRGFYATCIFREAARTVICGWMSGFADGIWNGCMATPREISVNAAGQATMLPIRETLQLRREEIVVTGAAEISAQADVEVEFTGALTLDFVGSVTIRVTADGFAVGDQVYPGTLAGDAHRLRVLLDRSFVELYFDDGAVTAARPVEFAGETLTLRVDGDARVRAWRMESVTPSIGF